MVPRPTLLLLALAASAIGAPAAQNDNADAVVDMKVPEQTPEQTAKSNQGHVVVNVFGNPDVEPMCRPNGESKYTLPDFDSHPTNEKAVCAGGWWCCSGYCDPLRGWRCVSGDAALKEEKGNPPQRQRLDDVEPMCRSNGLSQYILCLILTRNPLMRKQDASTTLPAAPVTVPGTRATSVLIGVSLLKKVWSLEKRSKERTFSPREINHSSCFQCSGGDRIVRRKDDVMLRWTSITREGLS